MNQYEILYIKQNKMQNTNSNPINKRFSMDLSPVFLNHNFFATPRLEQMPKRVRQLRDQAFAISGKEALNSYALEKELSEKKKKEQSARKEKKGKTKPALRKK